MARLHTSASFVGLLVLLAGAGACSMRSPTTPAVATQVTIYPLSGTLMTGAILRFAAGGGDGKSYSWAVDGAARNDCSISCEVSWTTPGQHIVTVSSGGTLTQAAVEAVAPGGAAIALSSISPSSGTQISFNSNITFNFNYVTPVLSYPHISFLTQDGNSVQRCGGSSFPMVPGQGTILATEYLCNSKVNGILQPTPFTTVRIRVFMTPDQPFGASPIAQVEFPATYIWK